MHSEFENLNNGKPVTFCMKLESKFPFAFPRVYSLSAISENPNLSDGRDYLTEVISK